MIQGPKPDMKKLEVNLFAFDEIGVDSILFDLTVPEIFYFKHDVVATNVIVFIGSPDVDILSVVSDAFPALT